MEDLLRIPDLARMMKVSETSISRYIKEYKEYVPHTEIRGELYFTSQVLEMLQQINHMKKERKPYEIIRQYLLDNFEQTIDVVLQEEQRQVSNQVSTDVLTQVMQTMQAVAQQGAMLQQMVATLDQRQEISELRQTIHRLEDSVEHRMNERDAKMMEFIREKQKERESIVQKAKRAVEKLFGGKS
jgi:DNA-binding transcriptional MerR regulator